MDAHLDLKQACLDLSNAALALFDVVETEGLDAPLEDYDSMAKLKAVIDTSEEIRNYYYHRNIRRMLALGVAPQTLLKMFEENNG